MRSRENVNLKEVNKEVITLEFEADRNRKREESKRQKTRRRSYDPHRKPPRLYKVGDVAIKRTQIGGPGLKLKLKHFGPYKVTKVKSNDTKDVVKEGTHEGPIEVSTCAEFMKPRCVTVDSENSLLSDPDNLQDDRVLGSDVATRLEEKSGRWWNVLDAEARDACEHSGASTWVM